MRHANKGNKLSRHTAHRSAMLRNLVTSLFEHGRVETTRAKAKAARPVAEKLVTLANARKKVPPAELKILPGINHLLVPAKTGEVQEYSQLTGSKVSPEVAQTIGAWLK